MPHVEGLGLCPHSLPTEVRHTQIIDDDVNEMLYIIMEYVKGPTLTLTLSSLPSSPSSEPSLPGGPAMRWNSHSHRPAP